MTPEITRTFDRLKREHGPGAVARVEAMMQAGRQDRDPLQAGAKYIMPGISKRPWHDPYEHAALAPLVRQLEARHAEIQREFQQLWAARARGLDNYQHYLMTHDDWKAFYIFRAGALTPESATSTPVTHRIVTEHAIGQGLLCPLLESHFSTLKPGAVIPPHCDLWNFSINLHLAVDIPPGCRIRVAHEERAWTEGKCLLFDYSFEHEAWNRSDRPRTCLLLDLWHPEVTLPEREALTTVITEIRKLTADPSTTTTPPRKWSPRRLLSALRGA
jgi:aspartyl/asparaginyl beta-hydroxylase (cupin superfamily)